MEEWGENKIDSFKSCVKLKKHAGCFPGFIVLLFWVFFPSWEIFLKSKRRILASFILCIFHPSFSPCSAFLIAVLLPNICEFGTDFFLSVTLEAVSVSLSIYATFWSVVCESIWEPGALEFFSSTKYLEYLFFFLHHMYLFGLKDEYNIMKITW